nr:hypothetical protein [Tanacetum cinerariifolium]
MKKAITIARIFIKKAIERFCNLTKEDAVKFLQDLARDYAKEKLKIYLEEKIQGLLQGKYEKISEMMFFASAALFGLLFARAIYHRAIERFSNLTKKDAVKFLQDLASDYAEEKLKIYLEEKIQGLLQSKDEKISEMMFFASALFGLLFARAIYHQYFKSVSSLLFYNNCFLLDLQHGIWSSNLEWDLELESELNSDLESDFDLIRG